MLDLLTYYLLFSFFLGEPHKTFNFQFGSINMNGIPVCSVISFSAALEHAFLYVLQAYPSDFNKLFCSNFLLGQVQLLQT
jgi:hypothetical protein